MKAIAYENTITSIPGWIPIHQQHEIGIAYEYSDYYIHVYGNFGGIPQLHQGVTASQIKSNDSLEYWARNTFGAEKIRECDNRPGEVISKVWRPGLYHNIQVYQALSIDEHQLRSSEQVLKILVEELDNLLLYIEPSENSLDVYSHKIRNLLILACTEIESIWLQYLTAANYSIGGKGFFTTNDYIKLCNKLFLPEYEIRLRAYKSIEPIRPFLNWNVNKPTQSLDWYNSYNQT